MKYTKEILNGWSRLMLSLQKSQILPLALVMNLEWLKNWESPFFAFTKKAVKKASFLLWYLEI